MKKLTHVFLLVPLLSLLISSITACSSSTATTSTAAPLRTWLLVRAPEGPLPLNKPIIVKSRTEDSQGVSHVELYAVQLPSGESNILLDSQPAPFAQTSFTASQTIVPTQKGHYAIKVVGYNKLGQSAESETISFEIE